MEKKAGGREQNPCSSESGGFLEERMGGTDLVSGQCAEQRGRDGRQRTRDPFRIKRQFIKVSDQKSCVDISTKISFRGEIAGAETRDRNEFLSPSLRSMPLWTGLSII
jgi:hypothetical protein